MNNVLQWVKVDNNTVDTFYRHLRCICIASVQEEIVNLGGANKAIELGVISLGMSLRPEGAENISLGLQVSDLCF